MAWSAAPASSANIHRTPAAVALVTPGVARLQAQYEDVATATGVQYPLGHVHGKLAHGLYLGVGLHDVVQDEPEVGGPAVEPSRLVLPGDPLLIEVRRPPRLQLAAEGRAAVLGDDGSLLGTQRVWSRGGRPTVQQCRGILSQQPFPLRALSRLAGNLQERLGVLAQVVGDGL